MRTFFIHASVAFLAAILFFKYVNTVVHYNATTALLLFLILFFLLWLTSRFYDRSYFRKLPKAVSFFIYFIKEMIKANLKIALDILSPRYRISPTVLVLPLAVRNNLEITLLTVIIALTPGTLSVDADEEKHLLYIHALYLDDHSMEELKSSIKDGFERRLLELTR
ncbi:Na+/H+ antiporter subunit E [Pontibacter ruber]|uniref:Na+/H+ antiporter subunit E n=1 Tax=Pontibacter ruber TaxID=1343895 RepID=A0ABW5CR72_9BACT|nr:Na+/H+ antiporter subunit E [Pontibacter ruber]